ncbi:PLP-dependent aminotransferase family protein [Streptacidiphilus carbonis]|uniref:MocR-like pyridoxine biosynthesis transcription factor PdxR n=1 Tax=Streptacidiphilus carbonis TaxID=105422 RepID=UPI000A03AF29|nr:PLP-dependent aminotransferase family protein [Streptacidiphilus carbonis]
MAEQRANSSSAAGSAPGTVDLHLDLDLDGPGGVRASLTDALREAVRSGRLTPGTRLPPSRSLAADLGVARNTVADAYGELVAEGWLSARQGSGTRVAQRVARNDGGRRTKRAAKPVRRPARPEPFAPFHTSNGFYAGCPDLSAFPRAAWLAAARRALATAPNAAFGYGDPRGCLPLREALAEYLARARGVRTDPERLVVCSGFTQGLSLLSRVLRADGVRTLAMESYGLHVHRELVTASGLATTPLTVDQHGAATAQLTTHRHSGAVLLTPAHQFPTGVPLHPDRRAAAVDWAAATGGLVLEDDYDGEFRYDRQPVGALQGLDPERVVYLGTASKSLAPALRLGWMALPEHLVDRVVTAKHAGERHPSVLDQLTLAEFIASGGYDRHLRAMRLRYRRRRDRLVAALAERVPAVRVGGIAAGLHAVLRLPPGTEQEVLRSADWLGLAVQGLDSFRHPAVPRSEAADGLVVGYGTPAEHAFAGALDTLCQVLTSVA